LWSACATDSEGDTNALAAAPEPVSPPPGPERAIVVDPVAAFGCDPSYPDVCIPPSPPDLDCGDVAPRRFTVLPPDPHRFDGNFDGVGCEGP
jgi:micrococcal nuclease